MSVLNTLDGAVMVLHSQLVTLVSDTVIGVTIALFLFLLYYLFVLRRAKGREGHPGRHQR